jgi:hypothetical protein
MSTTFSVETTKGSKLQYSIDLGVNVLEGLTQSQIEDMARQSKVIKLQGPMRTMNSEEEIEAYLAKKGYDSATVTEGVEKTVSKTALANKLLAKYSPEEIEDLLNR